MTLQVRVELSRHAEHRRAQSNLSSDDVELVRRYGVLEHRTGVRFYFVGSREVERYHHVEPRLRKLRNIVMIVSSDDCMVITVYRNCKALKDIRRKSKVRYSRAA